MRKMPTQVQSDRLQNMQQLVDTFVKNITYYKSQVYNETETRIEFLNKFFELLGWDVLNNTGKPRHLRDVIHEAGVYINEDNRQKKKKPDYLFRFLGSGVFFVEAKKPYVDITSDNAPAFQLRRYGWSAGYKISVLTNFNDLYIYDCSVRPNENDGVNTALIRHFNFKEYVNSFEDIFTLLSYESVANGKFDQIFENIHSPIKKEPFDKYFLGQLNSWRLKLGQDILTNNPEIDEASLNIFVQRLLNRIIFLRICEDRNVFKYTRLRDINSYDDLRALFEKADSYYDSGLFELIKEDGLKISDNPIVSIFKELYYPNSSYEFSVVDPFLIGQVYELFLGKQLTINGNSVDIIQKPNLIDSQGVVNTPKTLTDLVVRETLDELVKKKTFSQILKIKIADICCGSGNFLLSAFEYICNYIVEHSESNNELPVELSTYNYNLGAKSFPQLSFAFKRYLLENSIFGVDIDPLAIEVTKFSLLLRLLDGVSEEELEDYIATSHNKILPNLDNSIKNGNSLIDDKYILYDKQILTNSDLAKKIRIFNWNKDFTHRFDVILGNPPYIKVQNLNKFSPAEYKFYKRKNSEYTVSAASALDMYMLFIERGLNLLNDSGVLGFLIPNKFFVTESGGTVRQLLTTRQHVRKLLNFGVIQVFKGLSTYVCILVASNKAQENFLYANVKNYSTTGGVIDTVWEEKPSDVISSSIWAFYPKSVDIALARIKKKSSPLSDIATIFVGIQTSNNSVYVIEPNSEDSSFVYFTSKLNGKNYKIEKGILRKLLYKQTLAKFEYIQSNQYVLFPYHISLGKKQLISESELRNDFPFTLAYLVDFHDVLLNRNFNNKNAVWYGYGRTQRLEDFESGERLIWSTVTKTFNVAYDNTPVVFNGGGNGPYYGLKLKPNTKESIFYIEAILNHWFSDYLINNASSQFQGGYSSHGKLFIEGLNIVRIDFNNSKDLIIHDEIVSHVKQVMDLKARAKNSRTSSDEKILNDLAHYEENVISGLIDELYGVSHLKGMINNEER